MFIPQRPVGRVHPVDRAPHTGPARTRTAPTRGNASVGAGKGFASVDNRDPRGRGKRRAVPPLLDEAEEVGEVVEGSLPAQKKGLIALSLPDEGLDDEGNEEPEADAEGEPCDFTSDSPMH